MRRLAMAALVTIAVISSSYAATSHARMLRMLAEMDTVKLFFGGGFVSTVSIGRSSLGQHIPLVIIHDHNVPIESTARMFVICRQHGNEPASTEAMLGVIRSYFSQTNNCDKDLLKKVTILIVPMMNPDGSLRNKRRNANGADLNRDWLAQSQPETRAVAGAIRKWQPDLIIDAHELDENDHQRDFIECIGIRSGADPVLISKSVEMQKLISAKLLTYGIKAAAKSARYRTPPRLAHRYYSQKRGTMAILVETRQSGRRAYNCKERARIHMITAMTAARYLAGNKDKIRQEIAQWWNGRSKPGFAYRGGYKRNSGKKGQ